jgi:hypothetical protein
MLVTRLGVAMFLVRAAFWLTAVILIAPREGVLGIGDTGAPQMVDQARVSVLTNLNRVRTELAGSGESRDARLM